MAQPGPAEELRALEERLLMPSAADISELISEEFIEFGCSGRIWRKQDLAEHPGTSVDRVLISSFEARLLVATVALVTYSVLRGSQRSLRSSIWKLTDGSWRLVFHQGTLVP